MDQIVTNYEVYEDSTRYCGTAEVTQPSLNAITTSISGAGIAGTLEAIAVGHFEPMTLSIKFRNTTEDSIKLSKPGRHHLELRANQQREDPVSGQIVDVLEKHVYVAIPKVHNFGTIKPQSTTDGSIDFSVRSWKTFLGGQEVQNIDPVNYKCVLDGVDYLADERANLGI